MSKYGNKQTEVDGMFFDSKAEARRFRELQLLSEGGAITALETQPRFLIAPAFTYKGKKERAVYYIADFKYHDSDTDEWVIEDVKSTATRTQVYRIKRKLFLAKYGYMYRFEEVM